MEQVSLQVQHRIHDVFQDFGAGDCASFGDVTNQENCHARLFGQRLQARRRLAHLAHATRGRRQRLTVGRLYRVNDQHLRLHTLNVAKNRIQIRLCHYEQIIPFYLEPVGSHLDLAC